MFSHVNIGVSDFDMALRFYAPLMELLGFPLAHADSHERWAAWHGPGAVRPQFVISEPFDGQAQSAGNGVQIAFEVLQRETIARGYAMALEAGATCAGKPGPRPHYHAGFYGAYFRDPDGNKICLCSHKI